MAKVDYQKFLEGLSTAQLQDHLEAVWRGEYELTLENEAILQNYLVLLDPEEYAVVWVVLAALIAATPGAEPLDPTNPIANLFENLPEPEVPPESDFVWITKLDDRVCAICGPLHGKVIGENLVLLGIKTHPGCRCKIVEIPKGIRAMKIRTLDAGTVRAIEVDGKRQLEVLAAPFGSIDNQDRYKQWFTERTDFMIEIGDRRPLLYLHGNTPRGRKMESPDSIGYATASRVDEHGFWMIANPDTSELGNRSYDSALKGKCKASTGSVNYLVRPQMDSEGKWPPGEVRCWPIAELSIFDGGDDRIPVSDDAIVLPLRALFDEHSITLPDNFEAGEDKRDEVAKPTIRTTEIEMTTEIQVIEATVDAAFAKHATNEKVKAEEKAALRAEIEKELKEDPEYKATFNIGGKHTKRSVSLSEEDKKAGITKEDKEEEHEYIWSLMNPRQAGIAVDASRANIVETSAGLPMVPTKTLHKIHERRDMASFARGAGVTVYKTDALILNIPAETVSMIALPTIAEAGAYGDLEPTIGTVPATVEKHGGYVEASEEFLEDQDLFVPYLTRAIGRALGLAENIDMAALMVLDAATASVNNGGAGAFTKTEALAWYYALDAEYRDAGQFFMADDFLGFLRAAESANSPTFTGFSGFAAGAGDGVERFMGKRVWSNTNFPAWVAVGTGNEYACFADIATAYALVERKGITILVDPYFQALNGIIRYYFSARWTIVTVNADAEAVIAGA